MGTPSKPPRSPRPPGGSPPDDRDFDELAREIHVHWVRERLAAALERLPPEQRQIVILRYVEDWDVDVVAEMTSCTPGEVRRLARVALRALRADLRAPS